MNFKDRLIALKVPVTIYNKKGGKIRDYSLRESCIMLLEKNGIKDEKEQASELAKGFNALIAQFEPKREKPEAKKAVSPPDPVGEAISKLTESVAKLTEIVAAMQPAKGNGL